MDPITTLKQDHDKVRELFRRYNRMSEGASDAKWEICQEAIGEVTIHSTIEERIFYPAFREAGNRIQKDQVAHNVRAHEEITALMDEINEMGIEDRAFAGKFQTFMDKVEAHAGEEEEEMFPTAREILSARFDELIHEMTELKQQLAPTAAIGREMGLGGG